MNAGENPPGDSIQNLWSAWNRAESPNLKALYKSRLLDRFEGSIVSRSRALASQYKTTTSIDAEDLAQDARIAFIECLKRYDGSRAHFLVYANAVIDGALSASVSDSFQKPMPVVDQVDMLDKIAEVTDHIALLQALDQLTARHREVLQLRYWQNMTQEEVAAELELTQQRVQQIEAGALDTLRRILTKDR